MCMPVNRGPESIIYDSLSTVVPTNNVHFLYVYMSIKEDDYDECLQEKTIDSICFVITPYNVYKFEIEIFNFEYIKINFA